MAQGWRLSPIRRFNFIYYLYLKASLYGYIDIHEGIFYTKCDLLTYLQLFIHTIVMTHPLTAKGYPKNVRRISWRHIRISHIYITWTSQGYRHFRFTGYYPAQDISIYNDIHNDSKI